ncbi:MAG TPA: hypothetical protein VM299_00910 [Solirubrobacteraceae bacterium]|nr:hypothetical protein [Solirubrobacteraceae bacterium]
MRRAAIVVVVVLSMGLTACPIAAGQLGPQAPDPLTRDDQPPAPTNPDADDDGGLSTLQLVLIFGSAMAVLAGIAWVILRDAHRAAPVDDRSPPGAQKKLSARERERQQRQRRERAKAARRQRKRNRPR